tara:strand:+ start:1076 stop:1921 length:846 start_codon:yes stop_codon:yes gene_type:complete
MKYFSNLPSKTFTSTIGDFTICDFFSHYEVNTTLAQTQDVLLDDHSTLIELSQNVYEDNNSIWLFLLANNYIDPFELASYNVSLYKLNNKDKLSTSILVNDEIPGTPISVVGAASIFAPYGVTSGKKWEYSSVGNFSLTGGFALVESTDYYTGRVTLKGPKVNNFITSTSNDNLAVFNKPQGGTGYTTLVVNSVDAFSTVNKIPTIEDVAVESVPDEGQVIFSGTGDYPIVSSAVPPPPATNTGAGLTLTGLQYITAQNKNIKVFLPGKIGIIISNLVSFK